MELFRLLGKIAIDNTEANNAIDDTSKKAEDSANETEAVRQETGEIAEIISEQFAILIDLLKRNMPQNVFLNSRVLVGELAPGINTYLGKVYNNEMRGNTR